MINIIPTQITNFRAFGWIQDPSNFRSLCDVVAIFDNKSLKHNQLKTTVIPKLVEERDGRDELIKALNSSSLKIKYSDLVGTSFTPRSSARCNGIVQAAVKGQKREYIGDWPADNFVRWATAFGLIKYNYNDDTFEITDTGRELTCARTDEEDLNLEEKELIIRATLSYPPAVRILNLLSETEDTHLTKFEIGKKLGFIGEDGFTNYPQSILIKTLATTESAKKRNSMKTDLEGSSDKYARMISRWLVKLGLVEQVPKEITVSVGGQQYTERIGQAYVISAEGITALNRTVGKSRYKRISKNICFEMLATKGADREYLRTRRAYILKAISENKASISFEEIKQYLDDLNLSESINTIKDDVGGLINIGLNIVVADDNCIWKDEINDFILPLPQNLAKSSLTEVKEEIRTQITHISHEYLALIDLAYDSVQNRLFEMKTLELLTEECEYEGLHLGGSRKPDGIIYTTTLSDNYGVIIDTKAYSGGYNLPISQADEMERYIRENHTRDILVNSNQWWSEFGGNASEFYFIFVSGHFIGNYKSQLERISRNTQANGAAMNVLNLLLCANAYKSGKLNHQDMKDRFACNGDFVV